MELLNFLQTFLLALWPICTWNPFLAREMTTIKFDFIVVGGGSAGAVVASRLSENPNVKVLLLEAGGCPPLLSAIPAAGATMFGSKSDWNYLTTANWNSFISYPNEQAKYHQGKMLGGGSGIGSMVHLVGLHSDYDNWKALGNDGWGWKDVLPYFLKAEGNNIPTQVHDTVYHNTTGPMKISNAPFSTPIFQAFLQSGQEMGYPVTDVNGPNQTGVTQFPFMMDKGARWSTYDGYIKPAKSRSNLVVAINVHVNKVIFSSTKPLTAIGVQYTMNDQSFESYATKEIILSAGALNTPKLLMLSGIGPQEQLEDLNIPVLLGMDGVGENLQDHVGCAGLMWTVNCTDCTYDIQNTMSMRSIYDWIANREGPLTLPSSNEGVAYVRTKYATSDVPDAAFEFITGNLASVIPQMADVLGVEVERVQSYFGPLSKNMTFSMYPFVAVPKSRGAVTLSSSDPVQPPNIDFQYLSHKNDVEVLVEGVKMALKFASSPALRAYGAEINPTVYPGCHQLVQFSDVYWECVCRHFTMVLFHACGTCKMGPSDDTMAVVNSQLQVYNTVGLRVVDASVMPVIPSGNINAPVIMLAEKAADEIKKTHRL